ncbi:MAG: hypothetical protein ACPL4H_03730 [Anaerolineales bacterium]
MNKQLNLSGIIALSAFIAFTLSCNFFGGLNQEFNQMKSTAENLGGNQEYLATAKALVTQVQSGNIVETAQALATKASANPIVPTIEAAITEQGPALQATLQFFATSEGPVLQSTAQALLTQIPNSLNSSPQDIPSFEGEQENLVATTDTISFITSTSLKEVVNFYKTKMPELGWTFVIKESTETEIASVLTYTKDNRIATITISLNPTNHKTIVLIYIQNK